VVKIIALRQVAAHQRRRRVTRQLFGALAGVAAVLLLAAALLSVDWGRVATGVGSGVSQGIDSVDDLVASVTQSYGMCDGAGWNCVVDGDTFRHEGQRIRIADIDAPEVRDFKCGSEKLLGDRATGRLRELLSAGPFELAPIDRDEDVYGRKLRVVMRDGHSLGQQLVDEGLARRWTGSRRSWC
jgi:endonuclease YncB( thermonuclease family)